MPDTPTDRMSLDLDIRRTEDGYRQMAADEVGPGVIDSLAHVKMIPSGAFVQCRSGFWYFVAALPTGDPHA